MSSIDDSVEKVLKSGGKILKPKDIIPGIGYLVYCEDPEGNSFGILEADVNAK